MASDPYLLIRTVFTIFLVSAFLIAHEWFAFAAVIVTMFLWKRAS